VILAVASLTLSLQLQRTTLDILDGVNIEVVAHNSDKRPVSASFPTPSEYEIQILRGNDVLWTSLHPQPPGSHIPPHPRTFMPGPNTVAVYIWNGIDSDGTTPGPGDFTVRARLLASGLQPEAKATLRFINPVPVMAVQKLKEGDEVTIAGTLDATKGRLSDPSGTITLMKRLTGATSASVAVRGYLTVAPDHSPAFYVQRWAPLSQKVSEPVSIPSPQLRRH
jgi:hypothetical protein